MTDGALAGHGGGGGGETPRGRAAHWPGTGLRWLAILLVLGLTAELTMRIGDALSWGAPLLGAYSEDHLMIRDSFPVRGRPNVRYEKWRMNNQGFRGPDIRPQTAPGVRRVVVLGSSETFGLFETEGSEYPARMQQLLDSAGPGRFEVINAALPGMGMPAMVPYYQRVVAGLHPDVVVLYPNPSFYLDVNPLPSVLNPPPTRAAPPLGLDPEVLRPRVIAKGRDALKALLPRMLVTQFREWRLRQLRAAHPPGWVWETVPADRMALFGEQLDRLLDTIQATGTTVILATHTNRFVGASAAEVALDRRHLVDPIYNYYPRATPRVMIAVDSAANTVLREIGEKRHLTVVEIYGRIPPGASYFGDYVHFTDRGAGVVASILSDALLGSAGSAPVTVRTR